MQPVQGGVRVLLLEPLPQRAGAALGGSREEWRRLEETIQAKLAEDGQIQP